MLLFDYNCNNTEICNFPRKPSVTSFRERNSETTYTTRSSVNISPMLSGKSAITARNPEHTYTYTHTYIDKNRYFPNYHSQRDCGSWGSRGTSRIGRARARPRCPGRCTGPQLGCTAGRTSRTALRSAGGSCR